MIVPSIHLNGSGKQSLIDQNTEAIEALETALKALANATPHDRDYYIQSDIAGTLARKEHSARVKAVQKVRDELVELTIAIDKAGR